MRLENYFSNQRYLYFADNITGTTILFTIQSVDQIAYEFSRESRISYWTNYYS